MKLSKTTLNYLEKLGTDTTQIERTFRANGLGNLDFFPGALFAQPDRANRRQRTDRQSSAVRDAGTLAAAPR
jgi:hypothetical protein